jgi:hypothetical protein
VERVVTVALVCILFDGGMHIGWSRFRSAAVPIAVVGVLGTFPAGPLVPPLDDGRSGRPRFPGPWTLPAAAVTRWSRDTGYGRCGPRSALVIFQVWRRTEGSDRSAFSAVRRPAFAVCAATACWWSQAHTAARA